MTSKLIRIQCISLTDPNGKTYENILLYIKKLISIPLSDESIQLEEKDSDSALVFSFNQPYDIAPDLEFFQIIFLQKDHETTQIDDIIFYRSYLLENLEGWVKIRNIQKQWITYAVLDGNNRLDFSVQFVDNIGEKKIISRELSTPQLIHGHSMITKQFHEVVYCAICRKFILDRLSYQCEQCSIVTDRKCLNRIPFHCQVSSNSKMISINENLLEKHESKHSFIPYKRKIYQINRPCRNCGLQISQNALKCQRCKFIIHIQCEKSVPSLCGLSYERQLKTLENSLRKQEIMKIDDNNPSMTTSLIISSIELAPLSNEGLVFLPKFSDFEYIGHLGHGGYSNVYCVRHIQSKEYVTIKVVDGKNESAREHFEIERQILFRYSQGCPFMIKGYCSFHQGTNLFLVMEFVGDDSIVERMHRRPLNENDIRFYLAEIISVIQYLHGNRILYRDLKPEHILVCREGHIRLIDYGLGRILNDPNEMCYTLCGTPGYVSPDISCLGRESTENGYSYPADYWGIGKIFVEMLYGELFTDSEEPSGMFNILDDLPINRHISTEARSLAQGLLEIDPKKRLKQSNSPDEDIRHHPFFQIGKSIDWNDVDQGICKPIDGQPTLKNIDSELDTSDKFPYPIMSLNRGEYLKRDWINAGESKCENADEENLFRVYDHVNLPLWSQFLKSG